MEFIAGFCFNFLSKHCICGYYGLLRTASTSALLQLHSLLSVEQNSKRSSTFLTWGKGSHYHNDFHNIIHMFKLCIINSLEKMLITCWNYMNGAHILSILDMHYIMFKYSGTCWITFIITPLWRQGSYTYSYASFKYFSRNFHGQN